MILFHARWKERQERPCKRVPLTAAETWTIMATCLLLITLLAIFMTIERRSLWLDSEEVPSSPASSHYRRRTLTRWTLSSAAWRRRATALHLSRRSDARSAVSWER